MADALPKITQSLIYSVIAAIAAFLAISILLGFFMRARQKISLKDFSQERRWIKPLK